MTAPAPPALQPVHEAPLPPPRVSVDGVRILAGVPYAAVRGFRPLELDLYLPPRTQPQDADTSDGGTSGADTSDADRAAAPVVVFLHGGGWRVGSRHSAGPAYDDARSTPFERVALAGIAVASVDYRLSEEAIWPAQLHDVKAAVRWLRSRAGELGVDTNRIAAWGESAGGHLAELLALTGDDAEVAGAVGVQGPSTEVSAAVAWYAPSDVRRVATDTGADPDAADTREAQLLGAPVPTVPDAAAQASPIMHVAAGVPAFLLLHGRADRFIPPVQSERLRDALVTAGADVTLHLYDGADHMWLGSADAARDALDRTIAFLRRHLGSTP